MSMPINMPPGMENYGAINELGKILKREKEKGSKAAHLKGKIKKFHIAHEEVKNAIAESLAEEGFGEINPADDMVEDIIFGLSLGKIFEKDPSGKEKLKEKLKKALQIYSSESEEAKSAVADQLSEGSQQKVPTDANVVQKDIDAISIKTVEDPTLLFDGL